MNVEVSLKFLELPVNAKPNYGDDRVGDMTGDPEFADIADHDLDLADGTAVNLELRNAIIAADGGNKAQKDALPPVEKRWNRYYKRLARYVTEKASEKLTVDEGIAVVNASGFQYNKVIRTPGEAPGPVQNFSLSPVANVSGRAKVKSDSLGFGITYISIFHKDPNLLDLVTYSNNEVTFPASTEPFKMHITTDSRETEVELSPGVKWHGLRFGVNRNGKGVNSSKVSVIPQ
jgi:hypothetical protein